MTNKRRCTMQFLLTAAALLWAAPALAVDFTAPLLNEDGRPYERCVGPPRPDTRDPCEKTALTLGQFVYDALNTNDTPMKPDEIVSRGTLAIKVKTARDLELSKEQRDLITTALFGSKSSFPVAIVQALRIIDPAAARDR